MTQSFIFFTEHCVVKCVITNIRPNNYSSVKKKKIKKNLGPEAMYRSNNYISDLESMSYNLHLIKDFNLFANKDEDLELNYIFKPG